MYLSSKWIQNRSSNWKHLTGVESKVLRFDLFVVVVITPKKRYNIRSDDTPNDKKKDVTVILCGHQH